MPLAAPLALFLCCPSSALQDPARVDPVELLMALQEEFGELRSAFWQAYGELPEDERDAFLASPERPDPEAYVPRFLELAREHPDTEAAAGAYAWIVQLSRDEETVAGALEALVANHPTSHELLHACVGLELELGLGARLLTGLLESAPDARLRGMACYFLARNLANQASLARRIRNERTDEERRLDRDEARGEYERLREADVAALEARAIALLERVVAEFPEGEHWRGPLGEVAANDLFELRHLSVGRLAPEIEGEDLDGVPFKLSDYRGKVVLLDFWGHW